jgi:hypothetical protein
MFLLPKILIHRIDRDGRKFFWQGSKLKKSYHLVRWAKIRKSRKNGGLSIKDLRKMNVSLLVKGSPICYVVDLRERGRVVVRNCEFEVCERFSYLLCYE